MGDLIQLFPNDQLGTQVTCCFDCPYSHPMRLTGVSPLRMDYICVALRLPIATNATRAPKGAPPDWCPLRNGPVTVELVEPK